MNMLLIALIHIILNAHACTTLNSKMQFSHYIFLLQLLENHHVYSLPWCHLFFPWWGYIIYILISLLFSSYSTIIKLMKHIIKIICLARIPKLIAILLWSVQWDYPQCDIIRLYTNQNEKTQRWDATTWDDVHVSTGCFEQLREMREFLPYRKYTVQRFHHPNVMY